MSELERVFEAVGAYGDTNRGRPHRGKDPMTGRYYSGSCFEIDRFNTQE